MGRRGPAFLGPYTLWSLFGVTMQGRKPLKSLQQGCEIRFVLKRTQWLIVGEWIGERGTRES